jgi:hypothetical protein
LSTVHLARLRESATVQAVPLRARMLVEDEAIAQLLDLAGLPQLLPPFSLGRNLRDHGAADPGYDRRFE